MGKIVINPQFDRCGHFVDGLAAVEVGQQWGYIDTTGKFVINPQYENADDFSEGLASITMNGRDG
jgi:hypothetical protein